MIEHIGVPKGKGRPRFSRKSGVPYTPAKTRSYEADLCKTARKVMGKRALLQGPLHVRCLAAFPIMPSWTKRKKEAARIGDELPTKKPDADNILKMLDALNGVVWNDDCQIVKAEIEKYYAEQPLFRIEVSEMRAG